LHAWAFVAAIPLGGLLVLQAHSVLARVVAGVYVMTLLASFGTSAAYHRMARTVRARIVMRRLDHAMIFVLIAGTCVPMYLLAMPRHIALPALTLLVGVALTGFVLKLTAFSKMSWVGYAIYPILGWLPVSVFPTLSAHLDRWELGLVIAGGLIYTLGLPILLAHRPDPWPKAFGYHEVWHLCTVVAAACHFAAVWLIAGPRPPIGL
jgi:hemolysin III